MEKKGKQKKVFVFVRRVSCIGFVILLISGQFDGIEPIKTSMKQILQIPSKYL